jgi:uncharacterized protein YcfJ
MLIRRFAATAMLGALASTGALADHSRGAQYVYAPVVGVQPIVRYVTVERPRRECWEETVYQPHPGARPLSVAGPTIAGGLLGGVIGHQFGSGSGRDAMTILGTLVGSAVANQHAVRNQLYRSGGLQAVAVPVQRCEVVSERVREERIDGYDVTYEYAGQLYRTRLPQDPGDRVQLRVSVRPVGY